MSNRAREAGPLLFGTLVTVVACAGASSCADTAPGHAAGSGGATSGTSSTGVGTGGAGGQPEIAPAPEFERFCEGKTWKETRADASPGTLGGAYAGVIEGPAAGKPFKSGTLETMKFVPEHPFQLSSIRVAFGKGNGLARVRLMTTFGRSYPGPWPDMESLATDLVDPIEVDVTDPDPEKWRSFDVSAKGVLLLPTQHYMLVYEHVVLDGPTLALEETPMDEDSRALLFIPKEELAYGLPGNYRLAVDGSYFCQWTEPERWFAADHAQPFADDVSPRVAVSDLDGDGHDDVIVNDGSPIAYFGDGKGGFAKPAFDPFTDAKGASMVIFGDVDNDGDLDAFAAPYVSADGDGDKVTVTGGDCNDADIAVKPNAVEKPNGYDDDCDGVADDGTDTGDADADGFTIAAGDCDDTRVDVYPGAPELLDARDNDCDLVVDQTFVNRILLNDGTGQFTRLPNAGVEALDPSTAGGFGDGNADGIVDLYWGNWLEHYPDDKAVQDRYFTGNGDGTFTDAQAAAGLVLPKALSCYGVAWNDYDNDGAQDLYVANYHLYDNQLWHNDGTGYFTDVALDVGLAHDDVKSPYKQYPGGHSYGGDWADVDNDGDMDFYLCNLAHPRVQPWSDPSMFGVNQGAPAFTFSNEREKAGFVYDEGDVNAQFADFDNDGDVDLAVASLYTGHYSRLYRNDGTKGFVDVTYETNTAVHDAVSATWSDVDEDGDMDLLIADRNRAPYVHLFVNRASASNGWVELDLRGTKTNRGGVGARVTLTAGGVTQMREVQGGGGHSNTQKSHLLHFGLGAATVIESVTVRWVGGATEVISGVAPKGRFRIVEGSGAGVGLP